MHAKKLFLLTTIFAGCIIWASLPGKDLDTVYAAEDTGITGQEFSDSGMFDAGKEDLTAESADRSDSAADAVSESPDTQEDVISDADTEKIEDTAIAPSAETMPPEQSDAAAAMDNTKPAAGSSLAGDERKPETPPAAQQLMTATNYPTVYNGIDYAAVYDYNYYIAAYADIRRAYGNDMNAALRHFVLFGMKEGRRGNAAFNVASYKREYPDLRSAYGSDLAAYYRHYIRYGRGERRHADGCSSLRGAISTLGGVNYGRVYDYQSYITRYADIRRAYPDDDVRTLQHFIRFGMRERRMGNDTFDVTSYYNAYQDLRVAYGQDWSKYYLHYIRYGYREKRTTSNVKTLQNPVTVYGGVNYSLVYDYTQYIRRYADIRRAFPNDDVGALRHFVNYGMREQRQGRDSFDEIAYRYRYPDLRRAYGNDYPSYYRHYIRYGARERRASTGAHMMTGALTTYDYFNFSSVYDFNYYYGRYADLRKAFGDDEYRLLQHFISHGMREGRQGKASYTAAEYNRLKPIGSSLVGAPTVYAGINFAPVYDYGYYISRNADLVKAFGYNNQKVLEHFANHGMKEGRRGKESYSQATYNDIRNQYLNKTSFPKAINVLNRVGWSLQAAFNWANGIPYYGRNGLLPDVPDNGIRWFADYGFDNGKGNCYVKAATFYEMARVLGYNPRQMAGFVVTKNGRSAHSWVEIDLDGRTYVFDLTFHKPGQRNGYMIQYGQAGTWRYTDYHVMN